MDGLLPSLGPSSMHAHCDPAACRPRRIPTLVPCYHPRRGHNLPTELSIPGVPAAACCVQLQLAAMPCRAARTYPRCPRVRWSVELAAVSARRVPGGQIWLAGTLATAKKIICSNVSIFKGGSKYNLLLQSERGCRSNRPAPENTFLIRTGDGITYLLRAYKLISELI